jgi:hypothetical protein
MEEVLWYSTDGECSAAAHFTGNCLGEVQGSGPILDAWEGTCVGSFSNVRARGKLRCWRKNKHSNAEVNCTAQHRVRATQTTTTRRRLGKRATGERRELVCAAAQQQTHAVIIAPQRSMPHGEVNFRVSLVKWATGRATSLQPGAPVRDGFSRERLVGPRRGHPGQHGRAWKYQALALPATRP